MPRERGEPIRANHPMAWHGRVVARPHDVADGSRGERPARDNADQAVRRDPAGRDAPHDRVDRAAPRVRARRSHLRIVPVTGAILDSVSCDPLDRYIAAQRERFTGAARAVRDRVRSLDRAALDTAARWCVDRLRGGASGTRASFGGTERRRSSRARPARETHPRRRPALRRTARGTARSLEDANVRRPHPRRRDVRAGRRRQQRPPAAADPGRDAHRAVFGSSHPSSFLIEGEEESGSRIWRVFWSSSRD